MEKIQICDNIYFGDVSEVVLSGKVASKMTTAGVEDDMIAFVTMTISSNNNEANSA